jgi:hypothetical protein
LFTSVVVWSQGRFGFVEHPAVSTEIGDVADDRNGADAHGEQLGQGLRDVRVVGQIVDRDGEAFRGEGDSNSPSDAPARSGDERRVSRQIRAPFLISSRAITVR